MRGVKYTRQQILDGLREAHKKGIDLRPRLVQQSPYRWCYRYHRDHFRNWKTALSTVGISYEKIREEVYASRREARKVNIREELRDAYENGVDLSATNMQRRENPYSSLYYRAQGAYTGRRFWEMALADAELPVDSIVRQQTWDIPRIGARLMERRRNKKPMNTTAIKSDDYRLYKAICNWFPSYSTALKRFGISRSVIRHHHVSDITMEIIELHNRGIDLNDTYLKRRGKKTRRLVWRGRRRFGMWENAVNTAGIDYSPYRRRIHRWTADMILAGIGQLQDNGEPLNAGYVSQRHGPLYKAGCRHFGSWDKTLKKKGLDPKDIRMTEASLSKEAIIEKMGKMQEAGIDLNATSVLANKAFRFVYYQALRRFKGGWNEALAIYGLDPNEVRLKRMPYTTEELGEKFIELESEGVRLRPQDLQYDPENRRFYSAVMQRYASFVRFLDDNGIDSTRYVTDTDWDEGRGVLEYLRCNFDAGVVTGAGKNSAFRAVAEKYFGGVRQATEKAGLVYSRYGKITKRLLKDPKVVGILYRHNEEFLKRIAGGVYFRAVKMGHRTLDFTDLQQQAFVEFIDLLPKKPAQDDIRQFCGKQIISRLIQANRRHFREVTFGDDTYLDLFRKDGPIF